VNYIFLAIPFFLLLIFIELIVEKIRGTNYYRLNDAISSLSAGVLSRVNNIFRALIPLTMFALISENFAIVNLETSPAVWVLAFVLWDFCYYWNHRMGHEINIFWASHVVHHSSEEYNLSTALRQSSGSILGWIFYIPGALLGIDVVVWASVGALNLLYQFWVHTRHIPKLGWYENFFVTPSNHRVHHATNDVYIDRNYGGVFIVWDRLFGSFQEELDDNPCMFGIRKPLKSWNPVWANLHFYTQLIKDAYRAQRWQDKLKIWFMPTGWRPADVEEKYPLAKFNPDTFVKFDISIPAFNSFYCLIQHALMIGVTVFLMGTMATMTAIEQLTWGLYIVVTAVLIGELLEGRKRSMWIEALRHISLPVLLLSFGYQAYFIYASVAIAALGLLGVVLLKPASKQRSDNYPSVDEANLSG
jgi:alkylglycerol monooxygenase